MFGVFRAAAKKLFYRFFQEEDFEEIYITEVDEKLRKPIEGALVLLKYTVRNGVFLIFVLLIGEQ